MTWKERRKLSYLINEFDDLDLPYIYFNCNNAGLEELVIDFFKNKSLLIYPAKSYFVAIVYAHCLQKYFNEDFYEVLNDRDLIPDDKYFVPYKNDKEVYDIILESIENIENYKSTEKTIEYFKQEMLLED